MEVIQPIPITRIPISTGGSDDPSTKFCEVYAMENIQQFLNDQRDERQRVCYVCREPVVFNKDMLVKKRLNPNTWQEDKQNGELRYRHQWHGLPGSGPNYNLEKPQEGRVRILDDAKSMFIRRIR